MATAIKEDDEFSFPDHSNVPSSISFVDSSSPPLWRVSSSCPSVSSGLPEIERDSHRIKIDAELGNAKDQQEGGDKSDDAHGNGILQIRSCCYLDAEVEEVEDKMDKLWEELNEKEACGNSRCMVISSTRSRRPGGVEIAKVLKRILHPNTSRRVTKSH